MTCQRLLAPVAATLMMAMLMAPAASAEEAAGKSTNWRSFGNDLGATRFAPLEQIDATNFQDLEIAWRWTSISQDVKAANPRVKPGQFKAVPIVVGGVLYTSTAVAQVAALDAGTGKLLWSYDPEAWAKGRPANLGWQHRGVTYWEDPGDPRTARVFLAAHDRTLHALDARTGEPVGSFGESGVVDLLPGGGESHFGRRVNPRLLTHSSPPAVIGNTIVLGSIVHDGAIRRSAPPGHVRGFDVRSGKLKWVFHTIAQPGEFGADTWEEGSNKYTGAANVWTMITGDEELGTVYLSISTPTNDFYGGHRKGDNLFAESIVCLDAHTGKRRWHFQAVHHGLWDYDFPTPANLVDLTVNGREIKALAQVSKQAFVYVLDRTTGEPIWPIEERAVPPSTVPGERASPTQPFPTKPPAFDRQGLSTEDLLDLTPELLSEATEIAKQYQFGPLYSPPTVPADGKVGTLFMPGSGGGANWPGAALDPATNWLYIPSVTNVGLYPLSQPDAARSDLHYIGDFFTAPSGPQGLPLVKPPWARVSAIDLNTGTLRWQTPNGFGPVSHPALQGRDLGMLGSGQIGAPLLTQSLLFVTQPGYGQSDPLNTPRLNVFHKSTGEYLGHVPLPDAPHANPITYLHQGRQYIVVAVGGGPYFAALDEIPGLDPERAKQLAAMEGEGTKPELIALALPKKNE